ELREFLTEKAADLRRLAAEVEALKGLSGRIDNISAAAAEAICRGDLSEARMLFDSAREVQREVLRAPLEANAALLEKIAEIDLIEGKAETAFAHLSAAADSFAALDPLEPARRRIWRYARLLSDHGSRYGGPGLRLAAEMLRPALTDTLRGADPRCWV